MLLRNTSFYHMNLKSVFPLNRARFGYLFISSGLAVQAVCSAALRDVRKHHHPGEAGGGGENVQSEPQP